MNVTIIESLAGVMPAAWNRLSGGKHPFLRHEFLYTLEDHGAVGGDSGWVPQFVLAHENGRLVGAVPLYLKYHSWGEFVFDFAWAEAYQRHGLPYYPKLVAAVPYTPISGPRLLIAPDADHSAVSAALLAAVERHAEQLGVSSTHWLFTTAQQTEQLRGRGALVRRDCQFHWLNRDYRDFDDFLQHFSAEKRKKVKRERRRVREAGITLHTLSGSALTEHDWDVFYRYYQTTFLRKSGHVPFSRELFHTLGHTMPEDIVLVLAKHDEHPVAVALSFRGADSLYGRYWGASEHYHSLHFEACYYTGIDYCIAQQLAHFEPGAQGQHKISRGFLPTDTYSVHAIREPAFRRAIGDFLHREERAMEYHMKDLSSHSPYRS